MLKNKWTFEHRCGDIIATRLSGKCIQTVDNVNADFYSIFGLLFMVQCECQQIHTQTECRQNDLPNPVCINTVERHWFWCCEYIRVASRGEKQTKKAHKSVIQINIE